jgi:hypothetical protein
MTRAAGKLTASPTPPHRATRAGENRVYRDAAAENGSAGIVEGAGVFGTLRVVRKTAWDSLREDH